MRLSCFGCSTSSTIPMKLLRTRHDPKHIQALWSMCWSNKDTLPFVWKHILVFGFQKEQSHSLSPNLVRSPKFAVRCNLLALVVPPAIIALLSGGMGVREAWVSVDASENSKPPRFGPFAGRGSMDFFRIAGATSADSAVHRLLSGRWLACWQELKKICPAFLPKHFFVKGVLDARQQRFDPQQWSMFLRWEATGVDLMAAEQFVWCRLRSRSSDSSDSWSSKVLLDSSCSSSLDQGALRLQLDLQGPLMLPGRGQRLCASVCVTTFHNDMVTKRR